MFLSHKPGETGNATSSCGNYYTHNASHSSASVNEDSSHESIDINRDLFATKKEKLNQMQSDLESPNTANPVITSQNSRTILNASGIGAVVTEGDDHELKLAKRRQSNRESARRSRLRKQEALKNLQATVEELKAERSVLQDRLSRLSEECAKLKNEKESIVERVKLLHGLDAISSLKSSIPGLLNHENYRSNQQTIQSKSS